MRAGKPPKKISGADAIVFTQINKYNTVADAGVFTCITKHNKGRLVLGLGKFST